MKTQERQAQTRARIVSTSSALGKLIRFKREKLELSQKEVADAMGFSSVFLGRIEFGKCDLPLDYVTKLAETLKLSRAAILAAIKQDINKRIDKKFKK